MSVDQRHVTARRPHRAEEAGRIGDVIHDAREPRGAARRTDRVHRITYEREKRRVQVAGGGDAAFRRPVDDLRTAVRELRDRDRGA